jgi:hypothetical protein
MRAPLSLSLLPRLGAAALLSILLACSGDGITVPGDGSIARLVAVAGDGQQAIAGEPVPQPLVVRAVDRSDRPVTGVEVAFRFINTDGRVAPGTVATGVDGQATAEVTLGGSVGAQVVEARLVDPQGLAVEFELTALQRETPEGGGGGGGGNGNDGGGRERRQWKAATAGARTGQDAGGGAVAGDGWRKRGSAVVRRGRRRGTVAGTAGWRRTATGRPRERHGDGGIMGGTTERCRQVWTKRVSTS